MVKNLVIVLLAAGVAILGYLYATVPSPLGQGAARDNTERNDFKGGVAFSGAFDFDDKIPVIGNGGTAASSTVVASSSQICPNNVLRVNFPTATGTITLPSVADFKANGTCLSKEGSYKTIFLTNANDLAPGTTTIAKGASSSISGASTTAAFPLTFIASSTAELTGIRIASSGQEWLIWQFKPYR